MKTIVMLGCGKAHRQTIYIPGLVEKWSPDDQILGVDLVSSPITDMVFDLRQRDWPLMSSSADEIHCYETLEHITGAVGDYEQFFSTFDNIWRVLKPGGLLVATVPRASGPWAFGDPGHGRVFSVELLTFLERERYEDPTDLTRTDYRQFYRGDFKIRSLVDLYEMDGKEGDNWGFVLEARKEQ